MPGNKNKPYQNFRPDLDTLVRHNSNTSSASLDSTPDQHFISPSTTSSPNKSSKKQLRHYHQNARRTKIHLILDRKIDANISPQKKKRRVSYFIMSEQYKRKMSDFVDLPEEQEQIIPCRKISWGEESQFILFNKNKSCQAIRQAPRHKFSIDE